MKTYTKFLIKIKGSFDPKLSFLFCSSVMSGLERWRKKNKQTDYVTTFEDDIVVTVKKNKNNIEEFIVEDKGRN